MKRIIALAIIALAALLPGCKDTYTDLGIISSRDMHPFVSSREMPLTVTVVDTITGATVWTLDVPVDKLAVVQFKHDQKWISSFSGATPADEIRWQVTDADDRWFHLDNSQQLSGNPILMKVTITPKSAPSDSTEASPSRVPAEPAAVPATEASPTAAPIVKPTPTTTPAPAPAPAPQLK